MIKDGSGPRRILDRDAILAAVDLHTLGVRAPWPDVPTAGEQVDDAQGERVSTRAGRVSVARLNPSRASRFRCPRLCRVEPPKVPALACALGRAVRHSRSLRQSGPVVVVRDRTLPFGLSAGGYGEVDKDVIGHSTVPVPLARLNVDPISWADLGAAHLTPANDHAAACEHDDRLLTGVRVPMGVGARLVEEPMGRATPDHGGR